MISERAQGWMIGKYLSYENSRKWVFKSVRKVEDTKKIFKLQKLADISLNGTKKHVSILIIFMCTSMPYLTDEA